MTEITRRHYTEIPGITEDYYKVRNLLIELGHCEFTYARWDWMITHGCLVKEELPKIFLWERSEKLLAAVLFDCRPGKTFIIARHRHEDLYPEMLSYAEKNFGSLENYCIVIESSNTALQDAALGMGYIATCETECDAAIYSHQKNLNYTLPDGFQITDMKKTFDLYQYGRVLWKGFNHELNGEGPYSPTPDDLEVNEGSMLRPNVNLALKIAAVASNGNFAAYCGMWYDKRADFAVIEPVACDPEYRLLGLGKAVVLEGVKRAFTMGADYAVVGSSQQFYYSIGMRPRFVSNLWKKKRKGVSVLH